jgi:hypothetical protein
VTATAKTAHGVQVGQWAQISGVTPFGYNGNYRAVSGTTGNTLVYALATNPWSETGLGRLSRPLQAVAALNTFQGLDGATPPPPSSPSGAWYTNAPWPRWDGNIAPASVMFPGHLLSSQANTYPFETPDARSSAQCNFTEGPAGLPISILLGPGGVNGTTDFWLITATLVSRTNHRRELMSVRSIKTTLLISTPIGRGLD